MCFFDSNKNAKQFQEASFLDAKNRRFLPIKPSLFAYITTVFKDEKQGMKFVSPFTGSQRCVVMLCILGNSALLVFYFVKNRKDDFYLQYTRLISSVLNNKGA